MKKHLLFCGFLCLLSLLTACGKTAPRESAPSVSAVVETPLPEPAEPEHSDLCPAVNVDGVLYFDTGLKNTSITCGVMDGKITSQCEGWELPALPGQSNFGTGFAYQIGPEKGCISVQLGEEWHIFADEAQKELMLHPDTAVFCGSVEEVTDTAMLVRGYPEDPDCDCLGPLVTVPVEGIDPAPKIGDIAEILYDGIIKECEPGEFGQIYDITLFYSKEVLNQSGTQHGDCGTVDAKQKAQ